MSFIFDGHNDLLGRMFIDGVEDAAADFLGGRVGGHLDLQRMRKGAMLGGFCALWPPSEAQSGPDGRSSRQGAWDAMQSQIAMLMQIVEKSQGDVVLARSVAEIRSAVGNGSIAFVLHLEGCEGISEDLSELDTLYAQGLRSLGPVWNEPTRFGFGAVPAYPASPDTGPGLTEAGKRLLAACNRRSIMFDLSHLNEKGFWDVAQLSTKPLVATHSNAHALCAHSRNLTDDQLRAVAQSGGLVGINFATAFVHPKGERDPSIGLTPIVDQFRYIADLVGVEHVAFGSDFDGASVPDAIAGAERLRDLCDALEAAGFSAAEIRLLRQGNWLRVLSKTWGEGA